MDNIPVYCTCPYCGYTKALAKVFQYKISHNKDKRGITGVCTGCERPLILQPVEYPELML